MPATPGARDSSPGADVCRIPGRPLALRIRVGKAAALGPARRTESLRQEVSPSTGQRSSRIPCMRFRLCRADQVTAETPPRRARHRRPRLRTKATERSTAGGVGRCWPTRCAGRLCAQDVRPVCRRWMHRSRRRGRGVQESPMVRQEPPHADRRDAVPPRATHVRRAVMLARSQQAKRPRASTVNLGPAATDTPVYAPG